MSVSSRMPVRRDHSLIVSTLPNASMRVLVLLLKPWARRVTQRQLPGLYPRELQMRSMVSPRLYPWVSAHW